MSAKRLSMRKVKEVLRLKWLCGLSHRQIAKSCSIGRTTVSEYLRRAKEAGLSWPLPEGMDEASLDRLLFPSAPSAARAPRMPAFVASVPPGKAVTSVPPDSAGKMRELDKVGLGNLPRR